MHGAVVQYLAGHHTLCASPYETSEDHISCHGEFDFNVPSDAHRSSKPGYKIGDESTGQQRVAHLRLRAAAVTVNDMIPKPLSVQRSSSASHETDDCSHEDTLSMTWTPPTPTAVSDIAIEPYMVADQDHDLEETIAILETTQLESRAGLKASLSLVHDD
jgi:hypothetical protein